MYESMLSFPAGLFGDFERMRREIDEAFGAPHLPAGPSARWRQARFQR